MMQKVFDNWVYVYDETHAVKTGKSQFGLHFFRNHKYRKGNRSKSKVHFGSSMPECQSSNAVSSLGKDDYPRRCT